MPLSEDEDALSASTQSQSRSDFLAAILQQVRYPVFALDARDPDNPVYCAFSTSGLETTGFALSDVMGLTALEVYPDATGRTAFASHCEVARTGQTKTYELALNFKSGARIVETTLSPVYDANGQITHLIGTSDVTTNDPLMVENRAAMQTLTREIESFVAMAAHDLRTPMRNVQHITDMLRDALESADPDTIELLDMLDKVSRQSMELISDVLAHARATTTEEHLETFNFGTLCQTIIQVLDPAGDHVLINSNKTITGDKAAFQVVLRNLLDNALKHGQSDQLNMQITLDPADNGMVDVTVTDDGAGFVDPAKIFLDGGEFRTDSGYGLLGIRRLINARGGRISAQNIRGRDGCQIRFSLPARIEAD